MTVQPHRGQGIDTDPDALTLVIVSFNRAPRLSRLLSAVRETRAVRSIIVVDNASEDDAPLVARAAGARVIQLAKNLGYGAACNVGLRACTTKWVAFCNDDVEPDSRCFDVLIDAARIMHGSYGREVLVAPRLLDASGNTQETAHRLPTLVRQIVALLIGDGVAGVRNVIHFAITDPQLCGWASAACILGPASALRAIGGFDERYFMYVEDVDLFSRWHASGRLAAWVPRATMIHSGGRRPLDFRLYAECIMNWSYFFEQRSGKVAKHAIRAAALIGVCLRSLYWGGRGIVSAEAWLYCRMFSRCGLELVALIWSPARLQTPVDAPHVR